MIRHTRTTFMENFNLVWCKMRARRACKVLHVQKLPKYRIFSDFLQLWSNTAQRPIVCYFWNHACLLICNWTITMQKFNLIWCKMRAWRACKVLHVQKCENSSEFGSAITLRPFECQFWNLACIFITTRTNSPSNFVVNECKMLVKHAGKVCSNISNFHETYNFHYGQSYHLFVTKLYGLFKIHSSKYFTQSPWKLRPPCDYEGARVSTPLGVLSLHIYI